MSAFAWKKAQHIWAERFEQHGQQKYWQVVASPLRGDDGVNHGVALVIDDLTERKEQEEQRRLLGTFIPEALLHNIGSLSELDMSPAERKITAMFADVRGFTSFSEYLQPEDLMRIVNRYLGAASDAINAHDGIVDQYLGDAIKALWNTQLNHQEDHALRAVRAAQAILDEARSLHSVVDVGHRLHFGIGIHTGQSVLGMVGGANRIEFAALGEAADVSKFLQEYAEPGEIVISASTYAQVRDHIDADAITIKSAKPGYEDITRAYRVRSALAGQQWQSSKPDLTSPDLPRGRSDATHATQSAICRRHNRRLGDWRAHWHQHGQCSLRHADWRHAGRAHRRDYEPSRQRSALAFGHRLSPEQTVSFNAVGATLGSPEHTISSNAVGASFGSPVQTAP